MKSICTRCLEPTPPEGRYLKRGKPSSECKQCSKDRARERRERLPAVSRRQAQIDLRLKRGVVDPEKFRAFLRAYKQKHGLTWREVAERAGLGMDRLESILYDRARTPASGYDKELVADVVARLHGQPAKPSTNQLNRYKRDRQRTIVFGSGTKWNPVHGDS